MIEVEFPWRRPDSQDAIVLWGGDKKDGPLLAFQRGLRWQSYRPLDEETGLFLAFAKIGDAAGALAFADQFGLLGGRVRRPFFGAGLPKHLDNSHVERLVDWWESAIQLREAVRLWQLASGDDVAKLAALIRWTEDGRAVHYHRPTSAGSPSVIELASVLNNREFFGSLTPGDLVKPALFCVIQQINRRVNDFDCRPIAAWDHQHNRPAARLRPFGLLDALWLQFLLAVGGDKRYRQCRTCGKWFELSPALNRTNRQTCSNACRTLGHRRRVEEARQLHASGKAYREIAHQLETDVATVKGWIAKGK